MISLPHSSIHLLCFPFYLIWSVYIRGMRYPLISTYCEFKLIFFDFSFLFQLGLWWCFCFQKERKAKLLSRVWLFATPWTAASQAPPSMGFSRQEYWSGLPFPSPGDLPNSGIEPGSPSLQVDALPSKPPGKPIFLKKFLFCSIFIFFGMAFEFYSRGL